MDSKELDIKRMDISEDVPLQAFFKKKRFYWIRSRYKRFTRAVRWFFFMYKQPPWKEYESFIDINSRVLLEMAEEFETKALTMSSPQNAKRMRLTAKLLKMFCDEHYYTKHWDEARLPVPEDADWNYSIEFREGYNYDYVIEGHKKDQRCLELACKIIAQDLRGWWQ